MIKYEINYVSSMMSVGVSNLAPTSKIIVCVANSGGYARWAAIFVLVRAELPYFQSSTACTTDIIIDQNS
jgi:hypothetical protein